MPPLSSHPTPTSHSLSVLESTEGGRRQTVLSDPHASPLFSPNTNLAFTWRAGVHRGGSRANRAFGPPCLPSLLTQHQPRIHLMCWSPQRGVTGNRAFGPPCLPSPRTQPRIHLTCWSPQGGIAGKPCFRPPITLPPLRPRENKDDHVQALRPSVRSSFPELPLRSRSGWGCLAQRLRLEAYPSPARSDC